MFYTPHCLRLLESCHPIPAKSGCRVRSELSFGLSGTVEKVNVEAGDRVKQGDVLAELDTSSLALQVKQAEQAYLLQQANYDKLAQADPDAIASMRTAGNSANAAYQADS
jgi:multidrug efflux pump subunit AcrA (membrane-fusion protein)